MSLDFASKFSVYEFHDPDFIHFFNQQMNNQIKYNETEQARKEMLERFNSRTTRNFVAFEDGEFPERLEYLFDQIGDEINRELEVARQNGQTEEQIKTLQDERFREMRRTIRSHFNFEELREILTFDERRPLTK
jgi:hypothetical protein